MSFLAPLFALGALAVIGPILFHLIRRTTREVTPFSTLMFLEPTPPRITKRSRLENPLLLALRCLVIALLALGFARPFLKRIADGTPTPAGIGKRTVLLVDTSASMRRETLWQDALREADTILRGLTPVDDAAIAIFDRSPRTLIGFEEWRGMPPEQRAANGHARLAAVKPSWAATSLDTALLQAAEILDQPEKDGVKAREIIVIGDLQEGSRLSGIQGHEWPRGVEVVLTPVKAAHTANASLHWVPEAGENETAAVEIPVRLRVTNSASAPREQYQLRWNAGAVEPIEAYVPAGQSRIVTTRGQPAPSTGIVLSGDDTDFDNTLHLVAPQPAQLPILFIGTDADDDPKESLYYLRRAFTATQRQRVEITAHRADAAIPAFQLQQAQLIVLGENAPAAAIASAQQFAREGKIVLVPLANAAGAASAARLLGIAELPAREAAVKDYALLAGIDFQHPLFAPFADPRFSDFTKIHFWKYRALDVSKIPGARTVAAFDSGDPAVVQAPLGRGSVLLIATSWRPVDSQLALSSKFVPLLHSTLDQSSNLPVQKSQYFIGEEVPLPPGAAPLTVRKPDGTELAAAAGTKFTATDLPGIYSVSPGSLRFVVNLAPDESRIAPLAPEQLRSLGVPLRSTKPGVAVAKLPGEAARQQAAELEAGQKLWRWLIVAALGVLLLETLLARKLSHTTAVPEGATP